jgi:hypothetical protein
MIRTLDEYSAKYFPKRWKEEQRRRRIEAIAEREYEAGEESYRRAEAEVLGQELAEKSLKELRKLIAA